MSDLRERCLAAAQEQVENQRQKLHKRHHNIKAEFEILLRNILREDVKAYWAGICSKEYPQHVSLYLVAYHPDLDVSFVSDVSDTGGSCSDWIYIPWEDGSGAVCPVTDLASIGRYLAYKDEAPRA